MTWKSQKKAQFKLLSKKCTISEMKVNQMGLTAEYTSRKKNISVLETQQYPHPQLGSPEGQESGGRQKHS